MTQPAPVPAPAPAPQIAPAPDPAQQRVDIRLATGQMATVPAVDLPQALRAGATVAAVADLAAAAEPGGLLGTVNQAMAWQNAGLAGGTAGLGQAGVYKGLGLVSPDLARRYKSGVERAEHDYPLTNTVGELGGMVAASAIPIGGAARGVAGAGQAARAATGVRGVVGALGRSGLEAAAQQSAYNAVKQISEDELGDHDLNGERIVAAATDKDVLLAGGIGLGFGAIGQGVKAFGPGLMRSFRGKVPGAAADAATGVAGAGEAIARDAARTEKVVDDLRRAGLSADDAAGHAADIDNVARAAAKDAGGPFGSAARTVLNERIASMKPELQPIAREYASGVGRGVAERAAEREVMATAAKADFDEVLRAKDSLDRIQFTERSGNMRKFADPSKFDDALSAAGRMTDQIDEVTRSLDALPDKGGASGAVRDMQKSADSLRQVMRKVGTPESEAAAKAAIGELNDAANRAKQLSQKLGKMGARPFGLQYGENAIRDLSEKLRIGLEDSQAWGPLGDIQREINAAFHDEGRFAAVQQFGKRFGTVLETPAGVPKVELNRSAFDGYLKQVGSIHADDGDAAVSAIVDHVTGRAAVARKYGLMSAADAEAISRAESAAHRATENIAKARERAQVLNKLDLALEQETAGAVDGLGLAGKVYNLYNSPLKQVRVLGQIERVGIAMDRAMDAAAKHLTSGTSPRRVGAPRAEVGRKRDAVIAEIEGVRRSAQNPSALIERVDHAVGDEMRTAAPKHSAAVAATLARAVVYLAGQAPQGRSSPGLLPLQVTALRYSDTDVEKYERASEAVHHPEKVIADAAKGTLSREGVHALAAVYPKMYAQLQKQVMDHLVMMEEKGDLEKMPYQRRLLLGTLLQIPADESMRPEVIRAIQKVKATDAQPAPKGGGQQQGGGRRPFKLDLGMFQTDSQTIEAGGRA